MMINKKSLFLLILGALSLLILLNFVISKFYFRWDLSEDKLYTLSPATKSIIKELQEPIVLNFYFSEENKQTPQIYRNYSKQIKELLQEYIQINPKALSLEILDPKPDSDAEQSARSNNISNLNTRGTEALYLGLTAEKGDKKETISFFDIRKQESLEYDITKLIYNVENSKEIKVGIMTSLPVNNWAFYSELSQFYDVNLLQPTHEIPEDIDLLIVVHPKELVINPFVTTTIQTEVEYAIEQFLLNDGKVILMVDPFMRSDTDVVSRGVPSNSTLPNLFFHWGIEYDATSVVADPQRSFILNQNQPYFLWQALNSESFSKVPALSALENALFIEAGAINYKGKGLDFQPLITSSNKTGNYSSFSIIQVNNPNNINKGITIDSQQQIYAGLLTGNFTAAYRKRINIEDVEFKKDHLQEGKGSILIITDADWLNDDFSVRKLSILGQVIVRPLNDNLGLFLNLVEFMIGENRLYQIRSRGNFFRPFIKIQELERKAQQEYKKVEDSLQQELSIIRGELAKLQPKDGKIVITQEQKQQVENFQKQEKETFIRLREIRKLLRQDIESLKSWLKFLNIALIPTLVLVTGLFIIYKRQSRKRLH